MDLEKEFKNWHREFYCGHCQNRATYEIRFAEAFDEDIAFYQFHDGLGYAILKCRSCNELNLMVIKIKGTQVFEEIKNEKELENFFSDYPSVIDIEWIEGVADGKDDPLDMIYIENQGQYPYPLILSDSVPKQIYSDVQEAFNCLAIDAPNASVMMSRRVIQQIAIYLGVKEDVFLGSALNELRKNNFISDELHAALIEVKNWGDSGAHPGKIENIVIDEAEKVAKLMLFLVKTIFPVKNDPTPMMEELRKIREGKSRFKK